MNKLSVSRALWVAYGYLYDGLRAFYPYQKLIQTTVQWLDLQPDQTVLDLGCGTGNVLELCLQTAGVQATGVDISRTMLQVARRKLNPALQDGHLQLHEANIEQWLQQLPSGSVDRIVSVNVFYALDDRDTVWREAYRVLKPGGRMVVTSSTKTGSWGIIREHLDHAPWYQLLAPKLLGVFVVDSLINVFGDLGHFQFPSESTMRQEAEAHGWIWQKSQRCYGGPQRGVNVLFALAKK